MNKIIAGVLDFLIGIVGIGWVLTRLSGGGGDVSLSGGWFLAYIVAVVLYFILSKKYWKMTPGSMIVKRFLGKKGKR